LSQVLQFSASINKLSFGVEYKNFADFIADSEVALTSIYCLRDRKFFLFWLLLELKEFRSIGSIPDTLRMLTNAGVPSGFMRERETSRENSGSLRRRRWCWELEEVS